MVHTAWLLPRLRRSLLQAPSSSCKFKSWIEWPKNECFVISPERFSQDLALKVMELELPSEVMVHLMDEMSNTEERLAHGGSEQLQLGSLVGAFATARYPVCEGMGKRRAGRLLTFL